MINIKNPIDSWARHVKEFKEIPESFQEYFKSMVSSQTPFPYTIFAPPEKWSRRKINPKLIFSLDDRIFIAEKNKKEIITHCFLYKDIYYLEYGSILLYSWFKVHGLVNQVATVAEVEFNTVVEFYFREMTNHIRTTLSELETSESTQGLLKKELHKFDYLIEKSYKYMNFGKRSIVEGEEIQQIIFQPDIRIPYLKHFHRTLTFNHLLVLTNQELILIRDDDRFGTTRQIRYGGIWNYIPLDKIVNINLKVTSQPGILDLKILLPEGIAIQTMFTADRESELESLIDRFQQCQNINLRRCINIG